LGDKEAQIGGMTTSPRRGGRPSRVEAEAMRDRILDIAADLFLSQGYGATSIEAVAQRLRISKRTFYHRFANKSELFEAVVHRILDRLRPPNVDRIFAEGSLEEILLRVAKVALAAALRPEALALQRLVIAEAARFPELASIIIGEGSRQEAVDRIALLVKREIPGFPLVEARFCAEQFLQMVVSLPQRRALGLGAAMSGDECETWARETVKLFLHGCRLNGGWA
jgi:TetR/AcrR family transcriptional regulator, mexJK operon transcriptional repressor